MGKKLIKYDFNPFEIAGIQVRGSKRKQILNRVANLVEELVLSDIGDTKSPVTGRQFKGLSKKYKKRKDEEGATPIANLELEGDMLDSLTVVRREGSLRLSVGAGQQAKADGHNNFTGKSKLPERKFIPDAKKGEKLRPGIRDEIKRLVKEAIGDG